MKKYPLRIILMVILTTIFIITFFLGYSKFINQNSIPKVVYNVTDYYGRLNKTAVVMVNINDKRGKYSVPLWKQYCSIWNYDFIQLTDPNTFNSKMLHPSWWKIPLCSSVFADGKYDVILHVDADTLPVNLRKPIIMFEKNFAVGREPSNIKDRHDFGGINAGVFFLRKSKYVRNMLEELWSMRESTRINWPWEQGAFENFISKEINTNSKVFYKNVDIIDYGIIQSFFQRKFDKCQVDQLNECTALVAHIIRNVHPNDWEDIFKQVCHDRNIVIDD
jgi:hypothetical protein